MNKNILILLGSILLFIINPIVRGQDNQYLSFANDGAWCWFSDPRAVYFEGVYKRTYCGWVDSKGNIVVGAYDYNSGKIDTNVVHRSLQTDDHNNPALFIDNEGKIMVFYSNHAIEEPIYLIKSVNAEDIHHWETPKILALNDTSFFENSSNTYTYTSIVQLSEEQNKMYLFWRGTDFKPMFSTSGDNGTNWSAGKMLILPERIYKDRRPYFKIASNNKNTIHIAFTDGHPRDEAKNSIYYAKYSKNSLFKANNERITDVSELPLDPNNSDIVYDAKITGEKAWIWDVAENQAGNPVIVYARFLNDSAHVYYYAVWENEKWNNCKLVNSGGWFPDTPEGRKEPEPNYSGGIVLDHSNPSVIYLSGEKNGIFEIERWETPDWGKTWETTEITKNSSKNNVRPFVIRNNSTGEYPKVLWMTIDNYIHYTNYRSSIKMDIK